MKLLSGMALFILCALIGEGRARRLQRRERTLTGLGRLIREIGQRQQRTLLSFREAALLSPPSPEREQLLSLAAGAKDALPLLTAEERSSLMAYARSETASLDALRREREALLGLLEKARESARAELAQKGRVYRSVGYLCGAAALLLVL